MQKAIKSNISKKLNWQAKGFSKPDSEGSILCLDVLENVLNYALFSKSHDILAIGSLTDNSLNIKDQSIEKFIREDDILQHNFSKVLVAVQPIKYTLVPNSFFSNENIKSFYEFNCGDPGEAMIMADSIAKADVRLIYSIDVSIKNSLDQIFPNHHLQSNVTELISLVSSEKTKEPVAYLNFKKDHVDLLLFQNGLLFCNSFSVMTPEDLIYFILACFEQYEFDPSRAKLFIFGETETNSLWIKMIKKYIKNYSFAVIDHQFKKPLAIEGVPAHYYFNLLNRVNCE